MNKTTVDVHWCVFCHSQSCAFAYRRGLLSCSFNSVRACQSLGIMNERQVQISTSFLFHDTKESPTSGRSMRQKDIMQNLILKLTSAFIAVGLCLGFVSCKKDEPEDIKVTPSSINLTAQAKSSATFNIVYSGNWNIAGSTPDWISVSSASGNGSTQITVTALSDNNTSGVRSCELVIIGGSSSAIVSINQEKMDDIEVNPSSISLTSASNSTGDFSIQYSGNWEINNKPEWLNLSSTSGKGNTKITVTAISENKTASTRECVLTVTGNSCSANVTVSQLGGLKSGCEVYVTDRVILDNSYALKVNFGKNASYYYAGYLDVSAAGWTDDRIVDTLENQFDPDNVEDGAVLAGGGNPGDKFVQCIVAFDKDGNRGEVYREEVSLVVPPNNPPLVYITDLSYSDTKWYWTTTLGATAQEYYMVMYDGISADIIWTYYWDAEIAMIIKDISTQKDSYIQSQDWQVNREGDSIFIATWAKRNNKWSDVLNIKYGKIKTETRSKSKSILKDSSSVKKTYSRKSLKEYNSLKRQATLINLAE